MKLYTFAHAGRRRIGVDGRGQLIDLPAAYAAMISARGPKPGGLAALPVEMLSFLRLGEPALAAARETLAFMAKRPAVPVGERLSYAFEEVTLLAPILRPGKILCARKSHRRDLADEPVFGVKVASTIIGPGAPIVQPEGTRWLEFGGGLAVIIGQTLKHTPESAVMRNVAGYTILNDVSSPAMELKDNQLTLARNFDSFCPLGPCLVTADELPEPDQLRCRSSVNGTPLQDGTTSEESFPLSRVLHWLSEIMTLEPGDIVCLVTPARGASQNRPARLKPGDVVTVKIDGLGQLENPVEAGAHLGQD